MPEDKNDLEREHEAVIAKFRNSLNSTESRGEHAERSLKNYLRKSLGPTGSEQRKTLARDLIRASKDTPSKFRGGEFGVNLITDDPDPTGFEPRPWEEGDE